MNKIQQVTRFFLILMVVGLLNQWLFSSGTVEAQTEYVPNEPQLRGNNLVSPDPQSYITAEIDVPSHEIIPGEPFTATVTLQNTGDQTSLPYYLQLRLSDQLHPLLSEKADNNDNQFKVETVDEVAIVKFKSTSLAANASQQWMLPLLVKPETQDNQVLGLWGLNADGTDSVQAEALILVPGGINEAYGGTNSFDPSAFEEGWLPDFPAPTVSLFSGAATYGYAFDMAPARNGLQLNVGLAYSSRGSDGKIGWFRPGEVGEGWNLTGIPSITRNEVDDCWPGNDQWICVENSFSLVLNGNSYELQPTASTPYGVYQAKGEPGLYVERRNAAANNGSSLNDTSEYWIVRTTDGTEYRFGYLENSEQILFRTDGVTVINDPEHPYTGVVEHVSTYRWWVDLVKDVNGNGLIVRYSSDKATGGDGCKTATLCREVATYPTAVYYNNKIPHDFTFDPLNPGGNWLTSIEFNYLDYPNTNEVGARPIFLTTKYLVAVIVKNENLLLWKYDIGYISFGVLGDNTEIISISSIQKRSYTNPDHKLPAVSFEYVQLVNGKRCQIPDGSGGCQVYEYFTYPHLRLARNGYGGVYKFTYNIDNNGENLDHNGVRSFYVTDVDIWDGVRYNYDLDPAFPLERIHYEYDPADACFDDYQVVPSCHSGGTASNKLVGFSSVVVTVREGATGPVRSYTETDFYVDNPYVNGREAWQGQYNTNGTYLIAETETEWSLDDIKCPALGMAYAVDYACLHRTETIQYDPANNKNLRQKTVNFYEPSRQSTAQNRQWGVLTQSDYYVENQQIQTTISRYEADTTRWLLLPWSTRTHKAGTPDITTLMQQTLYLYDNNLNVDNQNWTKGRLSLVRNVVSFEDQDSTPDHRTFQTVDTGYQYDSWGNVQGEIHYPSYGLAGYSTITWDWDYFTTPNPSTVPTSSYTYQYYGLRLASVQNALGHTTTINAYHDRFFWLAKELTMPNQLKRFYEYDPFARFFAVYKSAADLGTSDPWDGHPAKRMRYWDNTWNSSELKINPLLIAEQIYPNDYTNPTTTTGGPGYEIKTLTYYDGLGRAIQSHRPWATIQGASGTQDLITITEYDVLGQVTCQTTPIARPSVAGFITDSCAAHPRTTTQYDYDRLSQEKDVIAPDGTMTQYFAAITDHVTVNGQSKLLRSQIKDANGYMTNYFNNAQGQLVLVRNTTPIFENGTITSYESYLDTQYQYDVLGNLLSVKQRAPENPGNGKVLSASFMTYDALGRKIVMDDADMGEWTYTYDARGNLISQTDAQEQQICFSYDAMNRLLVKYRGMEGSCGTPPTSGELHLATYVYDQGTYAVGMVSDVKWGILPTANKEHYDYDSQGRAYRVTRTIEGLGYTMETLTFDLLDRPLTVKYPDGEVVTTQYDFWGENSLTAGDDMLVSDIVYNAQGQIEYLTRGNGKHTDYNYYPVSGAEGNSNYRLHEIKHGTTSDALPNYTFGYEVMGNITSLTAAASGQTDQQTFGYDHLYRLTTASASGGVANYSHTYNYDPIGNLTSRVEMVGSTPRNYKYTYPSNPDPGESPIQPHAVTSVHYIENSFSGLNEFSDFTANALGPQPTTPVYDLSYDPNGNMVGRVEHLNSTDYEQTFDVENRLAEVQDHNISGAVTTFAYDANSQRTQTISNLATLTRMVTDYPFGTYEVERLQQFQNGIWVTLETTVRSSYGMVGQTIAQKERKTVMTNTFDDGTSNGWTGQSGTWSAYADPAAEGNYVYRQSNTVSGPRYSNKVLAQTGAMEYEWQAKYEQGVYGYRQAGLFFYASSNSNANHGNAYFVRQYNTEIRIYESINNTLYLRDSATLNAVVGTQYAYKVSYDPANGWIHVWRDGVEVLSWQDSTPLTSGSYIGLHTQGTVAQFDNIKAKTGKLAYFYTDHLGSTSVLADRSGNVIAGTTVRYLPYGGYRTTPTADLTERGFTGHHENRDIGLTYMNARYYAPYLNRFMSADTIVANPANSQSYNRYSYVLNNPITLNDPSGHCATGWSNTGSGDPKMVRDQNDSACWQEFDLLYQHLSSLGYSDADIQGYLGSGEWWTYQGLEFDPEKLREVYENSNWREYTSYPTDDASYAAFLEGYFMYHIYMSNPDLAFKVMVITAAYPDDDLVEPENTSLAELYAINVLGQTPVFFGDEHYIEAVARARANGNEDLAFRLSTMFSVGIPSDTGVPDIPVTPSGGGAVSQFIEQLITALDEWFSGLVD